MRQNPKAIGLVVLTCAGGWACAVGCGSRTDLNLSYDAGGGSGGSSGSSGGDDSGSGSSSGSSSGGDTGACVPGAQQCSGNSIETCGANGQWGMPWPCTMGTCANGACAGPSTVGASCAPGGAGMTNCGASSESCCTSVEVPGGTFYRTYTNSGSGPAGEADPASISGFRLDTYLVTVGRFRQFVTAWSNGSGYTPPAGSGKHTHLNAGLGLNAAGGGYEPGWVASDDSNISPTTAHLACSASNATWTASAGSQENLPINCMNWYEAYAFCIWDGGFLPSDAEWEYAAAGGSEQREYPWGSAALGTSNQYAIYGCYYPTGSATCTGVINIAAVGTAALGVGRWGQLDLAGSVYEWNLDSSYANAPFVDPCHDCADLTPSTYREERGGTFYGTDTSTLLPTNRGGDVPTDRFFLGGTGFRCARTP